MEIYDYNHRVKKLDILLSKKLSKVLKQQKIPFTDSQANLIMYLYHHQDQVIYQKNLPDILGISGPTGNGLVKRLVQKEAIKMQPSQKDARLKQLTLAPKIIKDIDNQKADFEKAFKKIEKQVTTNMTKKEAKQLQQLLDKAINNLEVDRKDPY